MKLKIKIRIKYHKSTWHKSILVSCIFDNPSFSCPAFSVDPNLVKNSPKRLARRRAAFKLQCIVIDTFSSVVYATSVGMHEAPYCLTLSLTLT